MTGTVWLVRHGESTWNRLGLAQGHNDEAELTDRGHAQAQAVADMLLGHPVAAVYASDLRRARQTAAPLTVALGLPVNADERLRERSLGAWEGSPLTVVGPEITGVTADTIEGTVCDPDRRPAGGESVRDLYQRTAGFAGQLFAGQLFAGQLFAGQLSARPEGDIVIVAHGGTVRVLHACLHGVPVEQMAWIAVPNGAVLRVPGQLAPDRRVFARREHT